VPVSRTPPVRARYLESAIRNDALAARKMAFISGPRQVGKTTLGRALLLSGENAFTWDDSRFRSAWAKDPVAAVANRAGGPVLLDEIHKDRRFKNRLKGLFDLQGADLPIVVTGSARLDYFRRGGDSLMGRYLPYRLHPFTVAERAEPPSPGEILATTKPVIQFDDLRRLGGFPEPLLDGREGRAIRWSRLRQERLVYEDLRDFRNIRDLQAMRVLVDLLPERVGSRLSINSLHEDVGAAFATVRDWIQILEALYHVFLIRPYAGRVRRALKAEPKLYLYDIIELESRATRLENLTALHLLKACHYWTDTAHGVFDLCYFRTKEKLEVDFVVTKNRRPWLLVECKSNDTQPARTLQKAADLFGTEHNFQLVDKAGHDREFPQSRIRVLGYERFLAGLV
jgi:hypothetical protein